MALIKGDLDTVLLRDEVGHLLLHVIAVLEYFRGALELRHSLEDVDTLHVRDKLTHLVLARFKRGYEVKTKNAPPFKMFLFIFREASEKKNFKKMMFSGRLSQFFKVVILPCKISLKMLQNTKNGIAPPNGVQSKNGFHG